LAAKPLLLNVFSALRLDHAGCIDSHSVLRNDHLMIVVHDVHTHSFELADKGTNLLLMRVAPHIANLLVAISSEDLVNCTSNSVGDGNLGFVGRSESISELIVLCPIK